MAELVNYKPRAAKASRGQSRPEDERMAREPEPGLRQCLDWTVPAAEAATPEANAASALGRHTDS